MQIDKIITLANGGVRLQFMAMERSLRAVGCDLPLWVIPYDDSRFDLPTNAQWWDSPFHAWIRQEGAHRSQAKYPCLCESNYVFTDTDIVFLQNPADRLRPFTGFVVADTDYVKPLWTYTPESAELMASRSSNWLSRVFNSGFFACDRALYTEESMRAFIQGNPAHRKTCLDFPTHEQPGLNLLVEASGVEFTNLNMPPSVMESTWAGDYPRAYRELWRDQNRLPWFIHWAGPVLEEDRPINELFYEFLTADERREWDEKERVRMEKKKREGIWPFGLRVLNGLVRLGYPGYHVQPKPR